MNVQHERQHLTGRLNKHLSKGHGRVAPTGRAYVTPNGTLFYEYVTMDIDSIEFWATNTRASTALPESPKYTICHNQSEMDDFE